MQTMWQRLVWIVGVCTLLRSAAAQLPTKAIGSVDTTCFYFKTFTRDKSAFADLLYGRQLYGVHRHGSSVILQLPTKQLIKLGNFAVDSSSISYSYTLMPAELSQHINTQGTRIRIGLRPVGSTCELTATYHLPTAAANNYAAKLYYAGVVHQIIDNAQADLGAANCPRFPSPTGICNNPSGVAFSALRREKSFDPDYTGNGPSGQGRPSARTISNLVHQGNDDRGTSNELSQLFTIFGQFLDHDLGLTPSGGGHFLEAQFTIPVESPEDPFYQGTNTRLAFKRSRYVRRYNKNVQPRNHINTVSSLIDGSQIYGNTWEKFFALREFRGGRLRTGKDNLLPINGRELGAEIFVEPEPRTRQFFAAGDQRANENEILVSLHTLWVREHNKVAGELQKLLKSASDELLFQLARRVIIAQLQSIVYQEWLPLMLGVHFPSGRVHSYNPNTDLQLSASFSGAAFRWGHSMVNTLVRRLGPGNKPIPQEDKELPDSFFNIGEIDDLGIDVYLRGAIGINALDLDHQIVDQLRNVLFQKVPDQAGMDLAALNIQRGRDIGLPNLDKSRFLAGLLGSPRFRPGCEENIRAAYKNSDDVDLFTGGMCEAPEKFSLLGPTFGSIVGDQFDRLKNGDKYWYSNLLKDFKELRWYARARRIAAGTVKISDVILRNTDIAQGDIPARRTAFQAQSTPIPPTFPGLRSRNTEFDQLAQQLRDGAPKSQPRSADDIRTSRVRELAPFTTLRDPLLAKEFAAGIGQGY